MKESKKIPLSIYIIILAFIIILFSYFAKYSYFHLQDKIEKKNKRISELYEHINDLNNSISRVSRDERIIEFAKMNLGMKFPDSKDIICVRKTKVSHNDFKYTFQNFISPEVLAAD